MPRALFLSSFSDGNLDAVELQGLHRLASKVDFPARKTIFSEGEPANFVFGLSKGYVRLYKSLADGRRQILSFALPGDFLGMPLRARHGLSADAIGDVVTCRFSRVEFSNFVQRSPNIIWRLNEFATRELERAQNLLLLVGNASAEDKVTAFLINWHNRLARLGTPSEFVTLPMLRQDIADFLGLELETVSRTFAKLQKKKVIRVVPKGVILTRSTSEMMVRATNWKWSPLDTTPPRTIRARTRR